MSIVTRGLSDKTEYLIKTFSRTERKDYENYVLTAVWNRIGRPDLKPVTQQYVRTADGKMYYIDLFFPQLAIAVEVDEYQHANEAQHFNDEVREFDLRKTLQLVRDEDLTILRIPIYKERQNGSETTLIGRPYNELSARIDEVATFIRNKFDENSTLPGFQPWIIDSTGEGNAFDKEYIVGADREYEKRLKAVRDNNAKHAAAGEPLEPEPLTDSQDYFRHLVETRTTLTAHDSHIYRDMGTTLTSLFGSTPTTYQKSYFIPRILREYWGEEYMVWFPHLAIAGNATNKDWNNELSPDMETIKQRPTKKPKISDNVVELSKRKVITFGKVTDPTYGSPGYMFLGVFQDESYDPETGTITHRRISDTLPELPWEKVDLEKALQTSDINVHDTKN